MKKSIPNSLTILIGTMITILVWVSFEVYRTFTNPADIDVSQEILKPLSPNLDISSLDKIERSIHLSEEELLELRQSNPLSATPSATPVPTTIPEGEDESPTPLPTESPVPTESVNEAI